jgi:endoglucanase
VNTRGETAPVAGTTRARTFSPKIATNWDWGEVRNLGMFTCVLSQRPGRDAELVDEIRTDLIGNADAIVNAARDHGYSRPFGTVARQTTNLTVANLVEPKPQYLATAVDAINHLLGRNVYGRSFVTGLGHKPPMNPHSRRSGADDAVNPWPGYLVGGANPRAVDWKDVEEDCRTNEIAINWNGALIYAFAAFVQDPERVRGSGCSRKGKRDDERQQDPMQADVGG